MKARNVKQLLGAGFSGVKQGFQGVASHLGTAPIAEEVKGVWQLDELGRLFVFGRQIFEEGGVKSNHIIAVHKELEDELHGLHSRILFAGVLFDFAGPLLHDSTFRRAMQVIQKDGKIYGLKGHISVKGRQLDVRILQNLALETRFAFWVKGYPSPQGNVDGWTLPIHQGHAEFQHYKRWGGPSAARQQ